MSLNVKVCAKYLENQIMIRIDVDEKASANLILEQNALIDWVARYFGNDVKQKGRIENGRMAEVVVFDKHGMRDRMIKAIDHMPNALVALDFGADRIYLRKTPFTFVGKIPSRFGGSSQAKFTAEVLQFDLPLKKMEELKVFPLGNILPPPPEEAAGDTSAKVQPLIEWETEEKEIVKNNPPGGGRELGGGDGGTEGAEAA